MYSYLQYKKNKKHNFDAYIDEQLEYFKANFIDKLLLQQVNYYEIGFFVKDFHKEKHTPINKMVSVYSTETVNIHEQAPNKLEEFKSSRYDLSQYYFKERLKSIERLYEHNMTLDKKHLALHRAIGSSFSCNLITRQYLFDFFNQHFSYTQQKFREDNYELFNTKEVVFNFRIITEFYIAQNEKINKENLIYPSGHLKHLQLNNNTFIIKDTFLKSVSSKNYLFQKNLFELACQYINMMNNPIHAHKKFLLLKSVRNFTNLKIVRRRCIELCYCGAYNFSNKSMFIKKEYKTDLAYGTYFLLNKYNQKSIDYHPLKVFKVDFNYLNHTPEELDYVMKVFFKFNNFYKRYEANCRENFYEIFKFIVGNLSTKKELCLTLLNLFDKTKLSLQKYKDFINIMNNIKNITEPISNEKLELLFKNSKEFNMDMFDINLFLKYNVNSYKEFIDKTEEELLNLLPKKYKNNKNIQVLFLDNELYSFINYNIRNYHYSNVKYVDFGINLIYEIFTKRIGFFRPNSYLNREEVFIGYEYVFNFLEKAPEELSSLNKLKNLAQIISLSHTNEDFSKLLKEIKEENFEKHFEYWMNKFKTTSIAQKKFKKNNKLNNMEILSKVCFATFDEIAF